MSRHRIRPPSPTLDETTAERLLDGVPIEDLPDAFQALGRLLADANHPACGDELDGSAAAAAAFVAAHDAAKKPRRRTRTMTASVLTALTLAATTGTAVAATQGSLPAPAQQVAHDALGAVGISVPQVEHHDDTKNDDGGGAEPASVTNGTDESTNPAGTPITPTTEPAASHPIEGGVPANSGKATTSAPVADSGNTDGTTGDGASQGGDGVAGENPSAGEGTDSGRGSSGSGGSNNENANNGEGNGGSTVDTPSRTPPEGKGKGKEAGPPAGAAEKAKK
jgi:hypothetical protein